MADFFPEVSKIGYGGPDSKNPLEFKHYNAEEKVGGKTMREHLRFSVVYWHTFANPLSDPFGVGTAVRPWDDGTGSLENAGQRVRVAFEFIEKLGAPFYAFHDRDVAPEGKTIKESHANLDVIAKDLKDQQDRTGVKLLWGTANLFTNRRYVHGAATSPNFDSFAFAAAQVKKALEVTLELDGGLYVLGRSRGLFDLAEHRHQTRTRSPRPLPAHGGRLQKADRLQGAVLYRTQAQRADQASVRLKRGGLPQLPARTNSCPTSSSTSKPITRPWPVTKWSMSSELRLPPDRSVRSMPTRAIRFWAGIPINFLPMFT